ncbi:MAG: hypothetical protein ACR2QF_01315 [Geminicoccaceae bacterium]
MTPGPWQEWAESNAILDADGNQVALVIRPADRPLIAAAPELLKELRHVLSAYVLPERKTCEEARADGERIKALIAKATA